MARNRTARDFNPNAPVGAPSKAEDGGDPNPGIKTVVDRAGPGDIVRAPMRGGTFGIIPEAERRIAMHDLVTRGGLNGPEQADGVKATKYRLVSGPTRTIEGRGTFIFFMYEGCPTTVTAGKEFSSHCYDIDILRRQGLVLEEIKEAESEVIPELSEEELEHLTEPETATA